MRFLRRVLLPQYFVFNASSASSNGMSLNDCLFIGPKLQTELSSIILRWRKYKLVYTADIAKMFRQILVHPDDTHLQRILWRTNSTQVATHFRLLTVTYGTAPAPYLAMRVLRQLCVDEGDKYPLATPIIRESTYVDDVLFGADDVHTIQTTRDQLNALLHSGEFHLRKWSSNYEELLQDIFDTDRTANNFSLSSDMNTKILGISWDPVSDRFSFQTQLPELSVHTKRTVLSIIARCFDPLGWIAPVIITAKIIMQELWLRRIDWNTVLPDDLLAQWNEYYTSLSELKHISIPRWTSQSNFDLGMEIHEFADASSRAYAAVVYIRILNSFDQYTTTIITSKSKVAPIKTVSIPRLELCAAVLLTRVILFVQRSLNVSNVPVYCWSDSMVTLSWIQQHPSKWKTFVANRVSEIQTNLPLVKWRYIESNSNPADCASRGLSAAILKEHTLWWAGPPWLCFHTTTWPEQPVTLKDDNSIEQKIVTIHLSRRETIEWNLAFKISSWPKLLRITAYCLLFIDSIRKRKEIASCNSNSEITSITLSSAISRAREVWITHIQ